MTRIRGSNERDVVIDLIGPNRTVLDCGAGTGQVASLLAANGCEVVGIEIDPARAEVARPHCKAVVIGNIDDDEVLTQVHGVCAAFDCVLCSHVLEHVVDPRATLARLIPLCRGDGGSLVIALPNVGHWRIRWRVLTGRWEYEDAGVLDRTHLRFFTRRSAIELLHESGLRIDRILYPTFHGGPGWRRLLRQLARRAASPGLTSASFVFQCSPRPACQP